MQTFLTVLIVLLALAYLLWQWWPRRTPIQVPDERTNAACTGCSTCGSCGSF